MNNKEMISIPQGEIVDEISRPIYGRQFLETTVCTGNKEAGYRYPIKHRIEWGFSLPFVVQGSTQYLEGWRLKIYENLTVGENYDFRMVLDSISETIALANKRNERIFAVIDFNSTQPTFSDGESRWNDTYSHVFIESVLQNRFGRNWEKEEDGFLVMPTILSPAGLFFADDDLGYRHLLVKPIEK